MSLQVNTLSFDSDSEQFIRHTKKTNIHTVDLVIFACLDFCEFVIFGPYAKSRICE